MQAQTIVKTTFLTQDLFQGGVRRVFVGETHSVYRGYNRRWYATTGHGPMFLVPDHHLVVGITVWDRIKVWLMAIV